MPNFEGCSVGLLSPQGVKRITPGSILWTWIGNRCCPMRARAGADPELAIILAGPPPGTLGMTGGFPNPLTFPTEELAEIAARLVRDEPGLALQYTASEGIPSVREYLLRPRRGDPGRAAGVGGADRHQRRDGVHRPAVALAAGPGRRRRGRGAHLPRRDDGLRGLPRAADRHPDGRRRARSGGVRGAAGGRVPAEVPLHHPRVPEPVRADVDAGAAARAGRRLPPLRRADLRGRRLPRLWPSTGRRCRRCGRWGRTWSLQAGTFSKVALPGRAAGLGVRAGAS